MPLNATQYKERLCAALNSFNWSEAEGICKELINEIYRCEEAFPEEIAKKLLSELRRNQCFKLVTLLAEAFIRSGLRTPQILRQYAQGLIDQGFLTAPEIFLNSIIQNSQGLESEDFEARGLIGRIYKQLYVNADSPHSTFSRRNLKRSLAAYWRPYNLKPKENIWHGINVAALLMRAERDRISLPFAPDATQIAARIKDTIDERQRLSASPLSAWDTATRFEALLALGDFTRAEEEGSAYSKCEGIGAFELASTIRQLEELWQLNDRQKPGSTILPILRAAYLTKKGAAKTFDPQTINQEQLTVEAAFIELEAKFGFARTQSLLWYKTGLKRSESIARIERLDGRGVGTGWLVNAGDFFEGQEGRQMLLTNYHVVPLFVKPEEARINFQVKGEVFEVEKKIYWSSPFTQLDAAFLTLKTRNEKQPTAEMLELAEPPVALSNPPQRLFIIGFPGALDLEFSLEDNLLLDANETLLHYRTPTGKGSSGSPVFEEVGWKVVALHHSGSDQKKRLNNSNETYEANEGISLKAIQSESRKFQPVQ